jgi:RNA polymerase sigma factor (sigma-70 family)
MELQNAEGAKLNNDPDNAQGNNLEQLIQIIQRKDATPEALNRASESLYKKMEPMMFEFAFRQAQNREDAEDIVQAVFTDFFTYLRTTDKKYVGSPQPFLVVSIRNRVRSLYRRKEITRVALPIECAENLGKHDANIASVLSGDAIRKLAKTLRNPRAEAIILYAYIFDMSVEEIAERLGLTPAVVSITKSRALQRLRQTIQLEDFGLGGE